MTFHRVELLTVLYEPEDGARIKVGRLATKDHELLFEYDPAFLASGLELSPRKLPLRAGVFVGNPRPFDGLMGLFEDSLPDGWGRMLMDRRAQKAGFSAAAMGPLDRLSLVGHRSMGALVYEPAVTLEPPSIVNLPEIAADVEKVVRDARVADLDRLIALGGSPQGARPKALVQLSEDGTVIHGDPRMQPGCTPYLVKFLARTDDKHMGVLEHAYMLMAAEAGIEVPSTRMLGKTRRHPGYFAVQRFDRAGTKKIHMHTVSGLLEISPAIPSLGYRDLLLLTRSLTRDETAVVEMFRRACFNVFAHNRDDHTRNFAFLMDATGQWRLAPAYDLTYSDGPGGEHATLVGTEGANPGEEHLLAVAASADLRDARTVIDQVRAAILRFDDVAEAAGLPRPARHRIARALGA